MKNSPKTKTPEGTKVSPRNQEMRKKAVQTFEQLLNNVTHTGYYGSFAFEICVQDGTIQQIQSTCTNKMRSTEDGTLV